MTKIVLKRNNCIGCNACVERAPDFWEIAEDGKVNLKNSKLKNGFYVLDVNKLDLEKNEKASKDCPVKIIKIFK